MNREQKRAFIRDAHKRGIKKETAEAFIRARELELNEQNPPQHICDGDKVMLDVKKIQERKNYEMMSNDYKEFVECSRGEVMTAHVERQNLISMVEEPRWLFWSGDLIRLDEFVNMPAWVTQQDS